MDKKKAAEISKLGAQLEDVISASVEKHWKKVSKDLTRRDHAIAAAAAYSSLAAASWGFIFSREFGLREDGEEALNRTIVSTSNAFIRQLKQAYEDLSLELKEKHGSERPSP
jgi:hypothetical protein